MLESVIGLAVGLSVAILVYKNSKAKISKLTNKIEELKEELAKK